MASARLATIADAFVGSNQMWGQVVRGVARGRSGADGGIEPGLQAEAVDPDHVGSGEGVEVGRGRFEVVGVDVGAQESVDLHVVAAQDAGEVGELGGRGHHEWSTTGARSRVTASGHREGDGEEDAREQGEATPVDHLVTILGTILRSHPSWRNRSAPGPPWGAMRRDFQPEDVVAARPRSRSSWAMTKYTQPCSSSRGCTLVAAFSAANSEYARLWPA